MEFSLKLTPDVGLQVSANFHPIVLRVLTPLVGGMFAWPWMVQLAQTMGWM